MSENIQLHDGDNDLTVDTNILNEDTGEHETLIRLGDPNGTVIDFYLTEEQKADLISILSN